MKTALIVFKKSCDCFDAEYLNTVCGVLSGGFIEADTIEILPPDDVCDFKKRLEEFKNSADNLIIVGGDYALFDAKSAVAEEFNTALCENENAEQFVKTVSVTTGKTFPENFSSIPVDSTLIPNAVGGYQGFLIEDDVFSLAMLPGEAKELKIMTDGYVAPYFKTKYGVVGERFIFKYFGDQETLNSAINEAKESFSGDLSAVVKTVFGDSLVKMTFYGDEKSATDVKRNLIDKIGGAVYANCDLTLSETLFSLLKISDKKISVAESFTGGRVISELIKNNGASEYVYEGIVSYSEKSKAERLGVSAADLKTLGAVSSKVAYEMAAGLLVKGNCDVAIATTGLAGPTDDGVNPVGLCYIAVGMKDGVHVFKRRFSGDREEISETAKNTALFLTIKKLKNI